VRPATQTIGLKVKFFAIIPLVFGLGSCVAPSRLAAPVGLADAILTLPSDAVSGMSETGRIEYLRTKSGDYREGTRRLHLYGDNPYEGGDADSMLFLRLFEDEEGRTIAASHSARPFADGSSPRASNTFVHRLENGDWVEITAVALPGNVSRDWWFRFDEEGMSIPSGPYSNPPKVPGQLYDFGEVAGELVWQQGGFRFTPKVLSRQ
jgi:hypothetical protein